MSSVNFENTDQHKTISRKIVNLYGRTVIKSTYRHQRAAIEVISVLLKYYHKEILIQSIRNYSKHCEVNEIPNEHRQSCYDFFKITDDSGFFELYIAEKPIDLDALMAYECCQTFKPPGNCKIFKNTTYYCKHCINNESRQNTSVELANNSRGNEDAGSRYNMAIYT